MNKMTLAFIFILTALSAHSYAFDLNCDRIAETCPGNNPAQKCETNQRHTNIYVSNEEITITSDDAVAFEAPSITLLKSKTVSQSDAAKLMWISDGIFDSEKEYTLFELKGPTGNFIDVAIGKNLQNTDKKNGQILVAHGSGMGQWVDGRPTVDFGLPISCKKFLN